MGRQDRGRVVAHRLVLIVCCHRDHCYRMFSYGSIYVLLWFLAAYVCVLFVACDSCFVVAISFVDRLVGAAQPEVRDKLLPVLGAHAE